MKYILIFIALLPALATEAVEARWQMGKPIVTYWAGPMPMTDVAAKQMADGNWNLVWVTKQGLPADGDLAAHYRTQLDILQRHGLRGIVGLGLWNLDDPEKKSQLDTIVDALRTHPAMYAYSLKDEPNSSLFSDLARMRAYLKEKDSSHLVYVNLYPLTASNKQLGITGDQIPAYREYVREFIKTVRPELLSYDHYHFGVRGDGLKYFLNLALVREAALEAGLPFMNIVQACSWTKNMRIPTGEELRWLTYTSLAYGAQGISHYVYGYRGHDGAMMNLADGSPTALYYAAREWNKEFVAIAKQLQPLRSLAVRHAGMIPEGATPLAKDSPFRLDPPVPAKDFPPRPAKLTDAEEAALFAEGGSHHSRVEGFVIGYFGKDNSPTHALVVNLDYRTYSGRAQPREDEFRKPVTRFIAGPGRLEVFEPVTSTWSPANAAQVELRLPPGGGKLVRLQ
ncbi:MAG: hypothetical protein FJ395_12995 [Verrucomicrobia bacterium]|nr:hypothetical protein [Verrucomicrobiota bacterium]